jgi:preprotein translocase subunit Sec61beta
MIVFIAIDPSMVKAIALLIIAVTSLIRALR